MDIVRRRRTLAKPIEEEINTLHNEIIGALRQSLPKAIRIGELLTQKKAKLKHGEWGQWIKEKLPFTHATVANYMRLHQNREKLKIKNVLNLSEAYKLLTAPPTSKDRVQTILKGHRLKLPIPVIKEAYGMRREDADDFMSRSTAAASKGEVTPLAANVETEVVKEVDVTPDVTPGAEVTTEARGELKKEKVGKLRTDTPAAKAKRVEVEFWEGVAGEIIQLKESLYDQIANSVAPLQSKIADHIEDNLLPDAEGLTPKLARSISEGVYLARKGFELFFGDMLVSCGDYSSEEFKKGNVQRLKEIEQAFQLRCF